MLFRSQIVERLKADNNFNGEITQIPPEGSLLPDTYRFPRGMTRQEILDRMQAEQQKFLAQAWEKRQADLPLKTLEQALVMASIVEKETGRREDRNLIAAVFLNRLRMGMRLQTDPSVIYGLGERFDGNLRRRDLDTDNPFNTYLRAGLPPHPIAMPGRESLLAAMNPAQSDALYFVARGDGSSEFSQIGRAHV